MRAARNKPGVVRVVLDLKSEVRPQIFPLKPVGDYGHRLVLDLYPVVPLDPLMALAMRAEGDVKSIGIPTAAPDAESRPGMPPSLTGRELSPDARAAASEESSRQYSPGAEAPKANTAKPPRSADGAKLSVDRLITVVLDAGHGCAELGEWERSEAHWRQALRLAPEHEELVGRVAESAPMRPREAERIEGPEVNRLEAPGLVLVEDVPGSLERGARHGEERVLALWDDSAPGFTSAWR